MSSISKQIEIQIEDPNPQKWCHPLKEDGFAKLMSRENSTVQKIFGSGSFFSPLLFGKFFDPSDAFPLWEFESDLLLTNPHINIDWFQTDTDYVVKAEIPGNNAIQVCVINGEIIEISGEWMQQKENSSSSSSRRTKDWKSGDWWEYGFVRRIELPPKTDVKIMEANLKNEGLLEIKNPKIPHKEPKGLHNTV